MTHQKTNQNLFNKHGESFYLFKFKGLLIVASLFVAIFIYSSIFQKEDIFNSTSPVLAASSCSPATHGAEALNSTGNPIGGGVGYTNMIDPGNADYFVDTKSELLSALLSAKSGDIIYVDDDAEINLTPVDSTTPMTGIIIPAGVTLASGRGRGASLGANIYTTYTSGSGTYKLFISGGDGVRITGLRIDGKNYSTSRLGSDPVTYGIYSRYSVEVDNNEISGFRHSAVNIKSTIAGSYSHIHHNYIHHNIRTGLGYGVVIGNPYYENANVTIEANLFDWNRHSIAASGGPTMSYTARYNIQLGNGTSHAFDVHGDDPNSASHVGGNAGNTTLIYGNTFYPIWTSSSSYPQPGVTIRGIPVNKAEVHDNYFYYPEFTAIRQYDRDGNRVGDHNYINMSVYNNCFDSVEPISLCSDGIQNQAEAGIDCGGPCISCQEYGDPPVISDISSSSIISTAAIITWTTNKKSDTQVEYGKTINYGYSNSLDTTNLVTSHAQVLFGLSSTTLYHYRVKSKDDKGQVTTSADRTFTTLGGQETSAIASWKFNENTGMTATDSSGNGNDGTINGATWTTGKAGSALSFDGANDYVNMGNPASLQITGAFSIEGWVKLNDPSISSSLFGKGHGLGSSSDYGYFLTYYAPTNALYFDTYSATTRDALYKQNLSIDKNWHHIAVTWDGTTSANGKKLYFDGIQIAQKTSTISSLGSPSYDFRVGIDSANYRPAHAIIDEVKVYNRAISASEVFAEYYIGLDSEMGLDSTPPELSLDNPSGALISGTTQTTISLSTDESSTCKYSTTPDTAYSSMTNTFATTDSTSHSTIVTGLTDDQIYSYYVRCQDKAINANLNDFLISFSIAPTSSQNTLIAHWKFDETIGTTTSDFSENDNTGTISGATWTQGINGNALNFDGINDYVEVQRSTSLDSINSQTTIEVWIKSPLTTRGTIIEKWLYNPTDDRSYVLTAETDGTIKLLLSSNGLYPSNSGNLSSANKVLPDTWTHIAVTSDGTNMKMYINGVLDPSTATSPSGGIYSSGANIHFGAWQYATNGKTAYFKGIMDEVKLYNYAFSASEILANYNADNSSSDTTAPVISAISTSDITSSTTSIAWTTNEKSDTQIEYGITTSYGKNTTLSSTLATSHLQTLSNLTPNTLYHYRVKSSDASGNETISTDQTFTTLNSVPSIPQTLTSTVGDGTASLSWLTPISNGGSAITGYKVYRGTSSGSEIFLANSSSLSYTDPTALNGTTYYYQITAQNSIGESDRSNETIAIPQATRIQGTVSDSKGNPLSNVTISDGIRSATTNVSGDYILNTIAGNYTLTASKPGYDSQSKSASVTTAQSTTVNFTLYEADIIPPNISNSSPSGTINHDLTQTSLSMQTDEDATCKYSTSPNTSYNSMTNIFTTTGNTSHSSLIIELSSGSSYQYYIKCQDTLHNQNSVDYEISFTIATPPLPPPDITPANISNSSPSGTINHDLTQTSLSMQTDEDATCKYSTSSNTSYNSMKSTFLVTGNTSHSTPITELSSGSSYQYYIKCLDVYNNQNSVDYEISFAIAKIPSNPNPGNVGGGGGTTPVSTDATPPAQVTNLVASIIETEVLFTWKNPTDGDYSKTKILRKENSYSTSHLDGTVIYSDNKNSFTDKDLTPGTTYYYSLYTYDDSGNYSIASQQNITTKGEKPTQTSTYPAGTLLKTSDSPKVYVIIDGKKKWIPTPEVFETLGYQWTTITEVNITDLDNITNFEDNLIRAIGGYKVYLVVNGIKRHIPNPEIFLDYGFAWEDVKDVSQSTIDQYQRTYLIRGSRQEAVYYLHSTGIRKHIKNPEIFSSYNNSWDDIQVISEKEMNAYPQSNLVQLSGDNRIYLIDGSAKRHIISSETFIKNGYNWNHIITVNQMEFDWYVTGSVVR